MVQSTPLDTRCQIIITKESFNHESNRNVEKYFYTHFFENLYKWTCAKFLKYKQTDEHTAGLSMMIICIYTL